jgi:ACS family sodium-dependent inorganic phosphate cotransporter
LMVIMASGSNALYLAGVFTNHLDIAPNYAGILHGVGNSAGSVAGIVGPPLVGSLVAATSSWNSAFLLVAAVNTVGTLIWVTFATGKAVLL